MTLSPELGAELDLELALSAPVGPQPGELPSERLFGADVSRHEVIANAAMGGELGPDWATMEMVNEILAGNLTGAELTALELIRRQRHLAVLACRR